MQTIIRCRNSTADIRSCFATEQIGWHRGIRQASKSQPRDESRAAPKSQSRDESRAAPISQLRDASWAARKASPNRGSRTARSIHNPAPSGAAEISPARKRWENAKFEPSPVGGDTQRSGRKPASPREHRQGSTLHSASNRISGSTISQGWLIKYRTPVGPKRNGFCRFTFSRLIRLTTLRLQSSVSACEVLCEQ